MKSPFTIIPKIVPKSNDVSKKNCIKLIRKHAETILEQKDFSWLTIGEVIDKLETQEKNDKISK